MKVHHLVQGSPEWKAHRPKYRNASDAPAALGCSQYKTRNELLHEIATGTEPEIDAAMQRRFDDGHQFEALARPIAEQIIGEPLYPIVGTEGIYGASFDGLTIGDDTGYEHKSLNDELRTVLPNVGLNENVILPKAYRVQMEQQCMVSGAMRILFMASKWFGGELVEERHCWYYPDAELRAEIIAGWNQFELDVAAYVPVEVMPAPIAAPTLNLPAVSVQVQGSIALISNLDLFGSALKTFISRIPEKPSTDQEFADCKSAISKLQDAQDALDAAEANALGQIATFDEMRRTKALYFDLARTTRLAIEKLVATREAAIKIEIMQGGKNKLADHIAALNARLGKPYMPVIVADWAAAIKSKRTVASLKNAVDTLLAEKKIEASAIADKIQFNLVTFGELAPGLELLFADLPTLVLKAKEDSSAAVRLRVAEHKEKEEQRLATEREKIAEEERIKAEAKVKADAEAAAREKAAASEAAPSVAPASIPTPAPTAATAPLTAQAPAVAAAPQTARISPFPASTRREIPADDEIIAVVANAYQVDLGTALGWIRGMDVFQKALVITMIKVKSSQIESVGHDAATNTLAIEFKPSAGKENGSVYHYKNVTPEQFEEFLQAESIGSYFGKHIKNNADRFPYLKVG
jgi:hypothetical protein